MTEINNFEELLDHYLKTASNIVTYFDTKDERDKILKSLDKVIRMSCVQDYKRQRLNSTISKLVDNFDKHDNLDEIKEEFKKQKHELLTYKPNVENHLKLIRYFSDVQQIIDEVDGVIRSNVDDDDDDVQVTQNVINIIDPFTKKRMTNPVRNKLCGHVYDRESVITILKIKKETRCPVIGCINKNHITEENLVSDFKIKKHLQKMS